MGGFGSRVPFSFDAADTNMEGSRSDPALPPPSILRTLCYSLFMIAIAIYDPLCHLINPTWSLHDETVDDLLLLTILIILDLHLGFP